MTRQSRLHKFPSATSEPGNTRFIFSFSISSRTNAMSAILKYLNQMGWGGGGGGEGGVKRTVKCAGRDWCIFVIAGQPGAFIRPS